MLRPVKTFPVKTVYKITRNSTVNRPASSVAKRTLSVREVWGLIPGSVKSTQCRQRLVTTATFLGSCNAQAVQSCHSLRALSQYREYNEDRIFLDLVTVG